MRKLNELSIHVVLLLQVWSKAVVGYVPASSSTRVPHLHLLQRRRTSTRLTLQSRGPAIRSGVTSVFSRAVNDKLNTEEFEYQMLEQENAFLRRTVRELELENKQLHETTSKIVIESFEREPTGKSAWYESSLSQVDNDMSGVEEALWCDELDDDTCPIEPTVSFLDAMKDRANWLVGLLILQSCSGFILSNNEALLERHPVIIYFLTMLVGAGGNAGNQASVRVIRGLALGGLNERTQAQFLWRELRMAGVLCVILSIAGFVRAIAFQTPIPETIAVTSALALIVFSSICLGAVLPLLLKKVGVDPAHSSTTIQVVMDILGVVLTVVVSTLVLDTPMGAMIVSTLTGAG